MATDDTEKQDKKQGFYFTQETEDAIIRYNKSNDPDERNEIYTKYIHPAFYKMAEIMIHRFKFYNFDVSHEDVKHEVITFLHEKLCKYDETTGYKAYSYFSIVAKNWLIVENNRNYYLYKNKDDTDAIERERNVTNEQVRRDLTDEQKDFIDIFVDIMERHMTSIFTKNRDLQIADSILYLFKTRDNIENYNKKAIYILIRERTGVRSQYITNIISQVKVIYSKLYKEYCNGTNLSNLNWYELQDIIND